MPDQEMIERVAKALNPRAFEVFDANAIGSKDRGLAMVQIAAAKTDAIAAIKAMREPTQSMMNAAIYKGVDCGFGCGYPDYEDVYKATIDSILND